MWLAQLNPQGLSQGDILRDVPTGHPKIPLTFLPKEPFVTKDRSVYTKYDTLQQYPNEPGVGHWISKGRISLALVVMHDCDLDDVDDSQRIVVAPVFPIARVTSNQADRDRIMQGARRTFVPLPGIPGHGDCFAELRSLCPLDRELFTPESRVSSMDDDAVARFRARLVDYFTRLPMAKFVQVLREEIEAEKAKRPGAAGAAAGPAD